MLIERKHILQKIVDTEFGGSTSICARKIGVTQQELSACISHNQCTERVALGLGKALGGDYRWLIKNDARTNRS